MNFVFEEIVKADEKEISKLFYLNKQNVSEMLKNNMYFGSHGDFHYYFEYLTYKEQKKEIDVSHNFFSKLGVSDHNFSVCFPYGSYNKDTIKILEKKKINFAFKDDPGVINRANIKKKYELSRIDTNYFKNLI